MLTLFIFAVPDPKWKPNCVRRKEKRHRAKVEKDAAAVSTAEVIAEPIVVAASVGEDNSAVTNTTADNASQPISAPIEASSSQACVARKKKRKQKVSHSRKRTRVSLQPGVIIHSEPPPTEPIPCVSPLPAQVVPTGFLSCFYFILVFYADALPLFVLFLGKCH